MNAHVNLGALRRTCSAGKTSVDPTLSTPHKSPAEEGVITAEFEAQIRSAVSRIDPAQSVQISVSPDDVVVTEAGRAREVHVRVSRPAPGVIGSATGWVLRADAHARVEAGAENDAENGAGHEGE